MKIATSSSKWCLSQAPFPIQVTFATPLEDLRAFVQAILAPFAPTRGELRIESIVFEPGELIWYLRGKGIVANESELNRATLEAESTSEVFDLLECVLGQWIDFAYFLSPSELAIYADHDEYTTIFASSAETLSSMSSAVKLHGFKETEGWTWTGPHSSTSTEGTAADV